MPLTLLTSLRAEDLVTRLASDLAEAPLSPFDEELVVVQGQGTARWLRNELARRTGCAASIRFPFPAHFARDLARDLTGQEVDEGFGRDALTWRILGLLEDGLAHEPVFEPLRVFASEGDTRKRLGLAARLASRFDDYQLYRADTLLAWERGEVETSSTPVEWQAALWRRLCADAAPRHLARWFTEAIARLATATDAPSGLPKRISVFGASTLPPLFIELLRAAGRFVPVRIYVTAPPRGAAPDPLHAAFGRTSRELLDLCEGEGTEWVELGEVGGRRSAVGAGHTFLAPTADRRPPTLSLHVCHSPLRELEVLRDQLFDAFEVDPTLRPHDILVMVPDVPTYAPLVEAVFGVGEHPRIPHRVADRPIAHESSLAGALLRMLRLVGARWTAAEVLELFDVPAVRGAAGVSEAGAASVADWIEQARIRWARDGAMRRDVFGVPAFEANSWRAGLDRLLMGYAVGPEESLVAGVLPHAGATIGDPETLGAFAHWVSRLFETLDEWRTPRTLAAWSAALREAVTAFLEPDGDSDEEALAALLGCVDLLSSLEGYGNAGRSVDLAVVRDWLERTLGDDSKGTGYLVGGMTVCALKPMRAIPFRLIAILGLDDASFPRSERRASHDLLEIAPRPGDPDRRADDRQLFLDTLLAARDRLHLSYVGRSAKDNTERAVSVVVAELLDHLDATHDRSAIVVEHRLQPFSAEYYRGEGKLFSYSRVNAIATAAAGRERRRAIPFISTAVDPRSEELRPTPDTRLPTLVALPDLIDCYANPAKFFCHRALELRLPGEDAVVDDCEPLDVDNITRYWIRDRILRRHLDDARDPEAERLEAVARGELPAGALTRVWYDRIDAELVEFLRRAELHRFEDPVSVRIDGGGWTLAGRVDGITGEGRTQMRPAKVGNRDLVRAWITHLALAAAYGAAHTTVVGTDRSCSFGPVPDARDQLERLVAGYRESLAAPLPFFEFASEAYARQQRSVARGGGARRTPIDAARAAFADSRFAVVADERDAYVRLCWRGRDPFADEAALARWSTAVWAPLLDAMASGAAPEVEA